MAKAIDKAIRFNKPVVVISADEYELLLKEAGYIETPDLNKDISDARKRFKKKKFVKWKNLKNALI